MSDVSWASETLRNYVAPPNSGQQVKDRIRRVARALGWEYERAKTIWYADDRAAVRPRELRQIEEYTGLRYGRKELSEIDLLIARADAHVMGNQDKDYYRAFAAGLRAFTRALDRSRAPGADE